MKVLNSSKLYDIPRSTLGNKLSGVSPEKSEKIDTQVKNETPKKPKKKKQSYILVMMR